MTSGDDSHRSEAPLRGCLEPRPDTLSLADDGFLLDLATTIVDRGLEAPALLWLDSLSPVAFLGSQAMHFLNPVVQLIYPARGFERLAGILEERVHLERLLRHLEAVSDEKGGEPES